MKRKRPKTKVVFLEFHGSTFRECLFHWLAAHPRTFWYRSGIESHISESVTMSISGWRKFCSDYGFIYKKL